MNIRKALSKKNDTLRRRNFPGASLDGNQPGEMVRLSQVDVEFLEKTFAMETRRHRLDTMKEMDKAQIIFSRILMAAAILTLGLILLSSFEIPFVHVRAEFVKLMIAAVIVEIAGIVSLGLLKNHEHKDEEGEEG